MLEVFDHGFEHDLTLLWLAMVLIQVESQVQIVQAEAALQSDKYLRHLLHAKLTIAEVEFHD